MKQLSRAKAFTLIELLVVISIISLLIAILLPTLAKARDQARKVRCLSNVRQINIASFSYLADNNDTWMRGQSHGLQTNGDFGRVPDFYSLYEHYLGGNILNWSTTTGGIDGNTYYAYDVRFNPAEVFICPNNVRRLSTPNSYGQYDYYRSAYSLYPASNLQFKMTQERLRSLNAAIASSAFALQFLLLLRREVVPLGEGHRASNFITSLYRVTC